MVIIGYLVVEEVDGVFVEPEREGLEEGDVVGHDLLVREVELVDDDRVDVVVRQQVVCKGRVGTFC
jgi:hypothetical protein